MNLLTASNEWGYSIDSIRDLCLYQFIPCAVKKPIWNIPNDAEKPPVTANAFIVLMESIAEFKAGGNPNVYRKGLPKDKVNDALYYLSDYGFISGYNKNLEYPESVKQASLLGKAYPIIEKYRKKTNLPNVEIRKGVELGGEKGKIYAEKKISY